MRKPTFSEEKKLWNRGCNFVIGVDEVGRGSFAGPVVAGAVVFKRYPYQPRAKNILADINDSKLLRPKKREELSRIIKKEALLHSIAIVGVPIINKVGVGKASEMAIRKAIKIIVTKIMEIEKSKPPIFVLADGFHIRYIRGIGLINQKAIIRGDRKSISIAAASIIAKVYRDKLMIALNKKYKGYKFSKNKGYGTKEHRMALAKYGLSKMHRRSFNLEKFL